MITLNGKKFINHVICCDTFFSQMRGLMFSKPLKDKVCLLFRFGDEKLRSLHTLFVFFPIDMIFLDKYYRVTEVISKVKPFRWHIRPKRSFQYLIETKSGKTAKVKIGDMIKFKYP